MHKGRLEAFSDGVIAVAITLLVLNITVPDPAAAGSLAHKLGVLWPNYAAYVISFLTIGIIWINHHAMISRLRVADHTILILNLLLLMSIAAIPFATDLMATYLKVGRGEHLAAAIYSGTFVVMSIAFSALNRQILFARAHLLLESPPEQWRRTAFRRSSLGLLPYVIATALAPVSPYVTLIICGALAVFYALPFASSATGAAE
jgi:uncharacterized membrane protein